MLLIYSFTVNAQFGEVHFVDTTIFGPVSIKTADFDNDGDLDIATVASFDDRASWYENINALGDYSTVNDLGVLNVATSFAVHDIDGDALIDILATSFANDKLVWYKNNVPDNNNFSAEQTITTDADGAFLVKTADMDSDGLIDLVLSSDNDNRIV